jgi:hypothetical protein
VVISCVQVTVKYTAHLMQTYNGVWENRDAYFYYIDFIAECLVQFCSLAHFVHVWWVFGVSFTLIDLFLFMNVRSVIMNLYKRVSAFRDYRNAMASIDYDFDDAPAALLASGEEKCAICLDVMAEDSSAKQLPCKHVFHRHCLEGWVKVRVSTNFSKSYTKSQDLHTPHPFDKI